MLTKGSTGSTEPGNRYLSATLEVGSAGTVCGPAQLEYLFDVSTTICTHALFCSFTLSLSPLAGANTGRTALRTDGQRGHLDRV